MVWADIRGFIADPGPLLERLRARLQEELARQPHMEDELAARRDRRGDFESQAVTMRLLLERLKDRVDGASSETRQELVRTLVERVTVQTLAENGRKLPKVTIRHRFGGPSSDCVRLS